MEFTNEEPRVRFTVVDRPTVRQQLAFWDAVQKDGIVRPEQYWNGLRIILEEWDCPCMPDHDADLGELIDPEVTRVILWSGRQGLLHMAGLDEVPKN